MKKTTKCLAAVLGAFLAISFVACDVPEDLTGTQETQTEETKEEKEEETEEEEEDKEEEEEKEENKEEEKKDEDKKDDKDKNPGNDEVTGDVDLFTGSKALGWDGEENKVILSADKFTGIPADYYLEFVVETTGGQFQICSGDSGAIGYAGTLDGAGKTDDGAGVWVNANGTVKYIPTAAEWTKIKQDGIYIQGEKLTITSLKAKKTVASDGGDTSTDVTLFTGSKAIDWDGEENKIILSADKFESATDSSVLEFKVETSGGQFQICSGDSGAIGYAGTLDGAGKTDDGAGLWVNANGTVKYTPTAAEWTKIKQDGIYIQGANLTITSLIMK